MRLVPSLALATVTLGIASTAFADTTYTYSGQNFTDVQSPYTTASHITGSFTVSDPPPDIVFFGSAGNGGYTTGLVAFDFTDGFTTFTLANTPQFIITYQLTDGLPDRYAIVLSTDPGQYFQSHDHYLTAVEGFGDDASYYGAYGYIQCGRFSGNDCDIGTWTASVTPSTATPEPSSLILLATGAAGLVAAAKRRLA